MRLLRTFVVLGPVILCSALAGPGHARAQADPLAGLPSYVEAAMAAWEIPGLAIGVVKDGEVTMLRGFGVRRLGHPERVDEHTLFASASTTKAFTTVALAMLVDEGRLRWDDLVIDHLPRLRLHDPYVTRELTIRDIVSHRSGLAAADGLWYGSANMPGEILARLRHQEPFASFRARYAYNNNMYAVAGLVIEAVSGMSWSEFVRARMLEPLGMQRTLTTIRGLEDSPNHAKPHVELDGELRTVAHRDLDNIAPAGSMNSSAADMVRWLMFHLDSARVGGVRLLSDTSHAEMFTPQTLIPASSYYPAARLAGANFTAYGLGWFLQDYRGHKLAMHTGSIDGMNALVALVPAERLGLVVLINRGGAELRHALMYRIVDAHLGGPTRDWSEEVRALYSAQAERRGSAEREREAARAIGTSPSLGLAEYAGLYRSELWGEMEIRLEGAVLVARRNGVSGAMEHWHHDTFRAMWTDPMFGRGLLTFELDADGRVRAVDAQGIGELSRVRGGG